MVDLYFHFPAMWSTSPGSTSTLAKLVIISWLLGTLGDSDELKHACHGRGERGTLETPCAWLEQYAIVRMVGIRKAGFYPDGIRAGGVPSELSV